MNADDIRARFLRDRVLTATPAQRVVMLYDRLLLDLTRAAEAAEEAVAGPHLSHAMLIVAELQSSLDFSAGGPADNLARIYGYLLRELIDARGGHRDKVPGLMAIVGDLRDSWARAIDELSGRGAAYAPAQSEPVATGAWVN